MSNFGYIYIFSNNEFKQDVYKIGKAKNVFNLDKLRTLYELNDEVVDEV
jgi:hypothetical protein